MPYSIKNVFKWSKQLQFWSILWKMVEYSIKSEANVLLKLFVPFISCHPVSFKTEEDKSSSNERSFHPPAATNDLGRLQSWRALREPCTEKDHQQGWAGRFLAINANLVRTLINSRSPINGKRPTTQRCLRWMFGSGWFWTRPVATRLVETGFQNRNTPSMWKSVKLEHWLIC